MESRRNGPQLSSRHDDDDDLVTHRRSWARKRILEVETRFDKSALWQRREEVLRRVFDSDVGNKERNGRSLEARASSTDGPSALAEPSRCSALVWSGLAAAPVAMHRHCAAAAAAAAAALTVADKRVRMR